MTIGSGGFAFEAVRLLLGSADLLLPGGRRLGEGAGRAFPTSVLRILGLRQVAQAAATARGGRSAHAIGGRIDALHALSMLGIAVVSRRYRRAAGTQVLVAGTLAALELGVLSRVDDTDRRS